MKNNSHYTLSISDLLMGFLFVFILIIMKFIIDYRGKKIAIPKPLEERACLLKRLKEEIEKKEITVEIDKENGILEFPDLCFNRSKYKLDKKQKEGLEKIRNVFPRIICYSNTDSKEIKKRWKQFYRIEFDKKKYCPNLKKTDCPNNPNNDSLIDTILIEGHADTTPIGNKLKNDSILTNSDLAMKRSQNVFKFLLQYEEKTKWNPIAKGNYLYALVNKKEKSLFGMTSYGNLRSSKKKNDRKPYSISDSKKERCIDIRFIMSQTNDTDPT